MPKDFLKGAADSYDVVVIGSGLGGMTAANILARDGMKVLLVEQHTNWGGWRLGSNAPAGTFLISPYMDSRTAWSRAAADTGPKRSRTPSSS